MEETKRPDICKYCNIPLSIKQTKRSPSQQTKAYYYTAYYMCSNCKRIFHDNKFKIANNTQTLFTRNTLSPTDYDVEIWTDGASRNNGRENAKAAWAFVSGDYEAAGHVSGKQTNNRAEAQAILAAMQWAATKGHKKLLIHTDSQITIFNMNKPLSKILINQEIFESIHAVMEVNNLHVDFKKVLGHSGDINNERADKLANTLAGEK